MNETTQKILAFIGSILVVYIAFKYLIPIILKVLGIVLGAILTVTMWVIIGLLVFILVVYIVNILKEKE